jgi:hypothetical protein
MRRCVWRGLAAGLVVPLVGGAAAALAPAAPAGAVGSTSLEGYMIPAPSGWSDAPGTVLTHLQNVETAELKAFGVTGVAVEGWVSPDGASTLLDLLFSLPSATSNIPTLASVVLGACREETASNPQTAHLAGVPGGLVGSCTSGGGSSYVDGAVFQRANVVAFLLDTNVHGVATDVSPYAQAQYAALPAAGVNGSTDDVLIGLVAAVVAVLVIGAVLLFVARRRSGPDPVYPGVEAGSEWVPPPESAAPVAPMPSAYRPPGSEPIRPEGVPPDLPSFVGGPVPEEPAVLPPDGGVPTVDTPPPPPAFPEPRAPMPSEYHSPSDEPIRPEGVPPDLPSFVGGPAPDAPPVRPPAGEAAPLDTPLPPAPPPARPGPMPSEYFTPGEEPRADGVPPDLPSFLDGPAGGPSTVAPPVGGAPGAGAPGPPSSPLEPAITGVPAPLTAPEPPASVPAALAPPPGGAAQWVDDPRDPLVRRYWDGFAYGGAVRWNGSAWDAIPDA